MLSFFKRYEFIVLATKFSRKNSLSSWKSRQSDWQTNDVPITTDGINVLVKLRKVGWCQLWNF